MSGQNKSIVIKLAIVLALIIMKDPDAKMTQKFIPHNLYFKNSIEVPPPILRRLDDIKTQSELVKFNINLIRSMTTCTEIHKLKGNSLLMWCTDELRSRKGASKKNYIQASNHSKQNTLRIAFLQGRKRAGIFTID